MDFHVFSQNSPRNTKILCKFAGGCILLGQRCETTAGSLIQQDIALAIHDGHPRQHWTGAAGPHANHFTIHGHHVASNQTHDFPLGHETLFPLKPANWPEERTFAIKRCCKITKKWPKQVPLTYRTVYTVVSSCPLWVLFITLVALESPPSPSLEN